MRKLPHWCTKAIVVALCVSQRILADRYLYLPFFPQQMNKHGSMGVTFIVLAILVAGLLTWLQFTSNDRLTLILLTAIGVVIISGLIILIVQFARGPHKIRKRLQQILPLLSQQSAEELKEKYLEIYNLYMKLKEKDKQNFYGRVTALREKIEGQLKAEKKLEELLPKAKEGRIEERKKKYDALQDLYGQLPAAVQEKYSSQVMGLKEELEKGK